jgi:subfamily B ATP-binding cassette protein HlyB/CyaB
MMVIAITLRFLGLVQPFVFQTIIDRVLPFQREATLILIVIMLTLTTIFSVGLSALAIYLGNHAANRLIIELSERIFRHVLNLPLSYLQRWPVGETLARINETDTVRGFLTGTISGIALDVMFAAVYVGALLSISPSLAGIVLAMLPLQIGASALVGPFLRQRMQKSFSADAFHQSRLVEAFGSVVTVKALACEELQVKRFRETLGASLSSAFRVMKLDIINDVSGQIFGNAPVILIIFLGSQMVFRNEITLGELVAFHLLDDKVSGPMMSLASIWEQWQGLKIARLRLGDFLNTTSEIDVAKPALKIDGRPSLRVSGVSFAYAADQFVIRDMDVEIDPAFPTVITGDSGSGKSTLAKLMSGLYVPGIGCISANGCNLADHDPYSVRRTIAYVPQEPELFSGSILDNLLLAKSDATDDEVKRALADSASDRVVAQRRQEFTPMWANAAVISPGGNDNASLWRVQF